MSDETYTEWAVRLRGDLGRAGSEMFMDHGRDERLAQVRVTAWTDSRPDVEVTLLRRDVVVTRGEWLAVDHD